jgi:hypothetical protein
MEQDCILCKIALYNRTAFCGTVLYIRGLCSTDSCDKIALYNRTAFWGTVPYIRGLGCTDSCGKKQDCILWKIALYNRTAFWGTVLYKWTVLYRFLW